jgi:hypothetical protein
MVGGGRLREHSVLTAQMAALRAGDDGDTRDFRRGALDGLRWLTAGGPGPFSGVLAGLPVSVQAIIRELAGAEAIIYGRPSACRDYACGVEHALMWAQFATAAPPVPANHHRVGPDEQHRVRR